MTIKPKNKTRRGRKPLPRKVLSADEYFRKAYPTLSLKDLIHPKDLLEWRP